MEFVDDTHLCLRCSETIVGLENYILHRQQHCLGVQNILQTCKSLPDVNPSLLPNTSTQSHISANDFFTSLELQSKVSPVNPFATIEFDSKLHDVFEYVSSEVASNMFNDLKSVKNDICLPEKTDESEGEDPPPTHTGGKWKPGFGPDKLLSRKSPSVVQKDYFDVDDKPYENNALGCVRLPSRRTDGFINEANDINEHLHVKIPDVIQQPVPINADLPLTERVRKCGSQINDVLTCELCDIHNLNSYSMYLHLLSKKHRLYFESDLEWTQHIFKYEDIMMENCVYQCHLCSYYFNRPIEILNHVKTAQHQLKAAQSKRNLICFPCEFECLGNDDLVKHLKTEHCFLPYTNHPLVITEKNCSGVCNYCKGACKGLYNKPKRNLKHLTFPLTNHLNIVAIKESERTSTKCPFCSLSTKNACECISHLLNDHSNWCRNPSFSDIKYAMEMNNLSHDIPSENVRDAGTSTDNHVQQFNHEKIECLLCNNIFNSEHFYMHVSVQHWEITKLDKGEKQLNSVKYKCSKCPYKTFWRNTFLKHEATHCSERPRPCACSECNSAFFNKDLLRQHRKLHSIPKYKCTICTREFHTNSELKRHKKVHLDLYPYLCDTCGYRAKVPQLLKRHVRVHTKERPFKCKCCSFSSATCSQLLRHERVHSGLKPYNCPYCSYSCNTQENLRKHVLKTKKHQNMKMYSCNFCVFECNMFNQYRNHLLNDHKDHFPRGEKDIISPVTVSFQSDETAMD